MPGRRRRYVSFGVALAAVLAVAAGVAGGATNPESVDWAGLGNTPDELRHSPLTQITRSNVDQLGRVFTVDFQQIDPRCAPRPAVVPARDRRHALRDDERRQRLRARRRRPARCIWRCKPRQRRASSRTSASSRTAASPTATARLFIAHARHDDRRARPGDRQAARARPDRHAVPGASSNYGYSETSAPICANHRVVVGAAGSEYGVRGFVMAYHDRPHAGLAEPVLDDPAGRHELAAARRARRRRRRLDADDGRPDDEHALLRHRLGDAALLPALRPGANPRADSLIAVDLATGQHEVVAAADRRQRVVVRHRAAAARLHGEGRRQERAHRLGRDDGGRLVRVRRRRPARPIYQRVKVIDRIEHPPLQPGQAGGRLPVLARRPQLLARVVRPERRTTSSTPRPRRPPSLVQAKLTPTQKKRKLLLGDVFLGLAERQLRRGARRAGTTTARSARSTSATRQARLEVQDAGARARRRDDHRERARLRRRRRRRAARVRLEDGQGALDVPDRPSRSRPGRRSSAGGKEYSRSRSGGTPTSSNGGTASQLLVFTLGTGTTARHDAECPARGGLARDWRRAQCPPHARGNRWRRSDHRQRRRRPARALASRQLERSHRRGAPRSARQACRWRRRRGRPLPAAQEDRRPGSLLRARGLDARPSAPNPCRGRLPCNRGRAPADRRREEDVESRLGRCVRRLPARRSSREAVGARRLRHRARRARRWCPRPRSRPALVSPAGDDHGREREPRARRDRRHEDNRSRLLDVLRAFQRERPLRLLLLRLRRGRERPGRR